MGFDGKVAVVTGAGLGIGRAAALLLAKEGGKVAVLDLNEGSGEETVQLIKGSGGEARFFQADVSCATDVERAIRAVEKAFGRIDILVNNAGIYKKGDLFGTSIDDWNKLMATNLTGVFLCSKYCAETMAGQGGGVIVNVASEAGLVGIRGQVAYNVSKGGVIALSRSAAVDLAPMNIRVNCVCPGTTETPLVAKAISMDPDPEGARRALESCRPANRLGRPEEIAQAILFLASDEAAYATGSVLSIDGGYTAQ
ncbi:MAG: SDR family oxidoreductase [Firmicutes bacterium]|jgi:NAD(P)-dependent dehydrogenase (short-subunit alcohol dehydrogenase family)|nr:SDR family oxidoreductase [Bacillota bacterium]MDH7494747.1 SDR family NAD(P)-dependent oxidoreductase [Bacillota bacterium]